MAKGSTKPKNQGGTTAVSRNILARQWMVLRVLIVAGALAAIVFFRTFLGNVIFDTMGFALVLWLLWLPAIVFVVWRKRVRSSAKRWNVCLGALCLTFAAWGALALFYPAGLAIGDVEFDTVSLGGNIGAYLIGNQGAGAPPALRLPLLVVASAALIAPRTSLNLLKSLGRAAGAAALAALAAARDSLVWMGHHLAELYRKYPPYRILTAPAMALAAFLRPRRPKEAEAGQSTAGTLVAEKPATTPAAATIRQRPAPAAEVSAPDKGKKAPDRGEPAARPAVAEQGQLPSLGLLDSTAEVEFTEADNLQRARLIEEALASYGVEGKVVQINPGPSVTQFGVDPGWDRKYKRVVERDHNGKAKLDKDGNRVEKLEEVSKTRVKVERITALSNNLALALSSPSIRIEAPVPGKSLVGIEVPNTTSVSVHLRSVIESPVFQKLKAKSNLALALGKGAAGEPVAADLSKMPHLLIAGTTGSGKTVCLNSIITCLLMHNTPRDVRLILIDPKRVELVSYNGVPHLMSPVVIEVERAIESLRRVIREMDNRYKKFSAVGVRNIEGYNRSPLTTEPMPYLVVIIDELADLMMTAAEVVEPSICRLAQLARATGIHLIIATQRPSVDVVTGLIKANFPTRIAFAVASMVDSRTILDTPGAEKLLGRGDMLYMPPDAAKPKRLRGCFLADQEIDRVVRFWMQPHEQAAEPTPDPVADEFASLKVDQTRSEDPLLATARRLAKDSSHISTSLLQRRLHVGYPRAARIMDTLEEEGLVHRDETPTVEDVLEVDEEEEE